MLSCALVRRSAQRTVGGTTTADRSDALGRRATV